MGNIIVRAICAVILIVIFYGLGKDQTTQPTRQVRRIKKKPKGHAFNVLIKHTKDNGVVFENLVVIAESTKITDDDIIAHCKEKGIEYFELIKIE